MKKSKNIHVHQPAKFQLRIRLNNYIDGEQSPEILARITTSLCAAKIYSMGEEGIHPCSAASANG